MEAVRLRDRMAGADLVVTGEGKFDEQSLHGKAPGAVLRLATELGVPAIVLCGRADAKAEGVRVASLTERFGANEAEERAGPLLEQLAAEEIEEFVRRGSPARENGSHGRHWLEEET